MNEQEISNVVKAVLEEREKKGVSRNEKHVCTCKKHRMTLDIANTLIGKIRGEAERMGVCVVIAVADEAGHPVAVQSMDGAYIASFEIALNKAFTSASLKMSTQTLSGLSQPGQSLYGIQFTNGGRIVIFGGGEVLEADGALIGALGVSGGSAAEDTRLAAYGKEVFETGI
ncbi:MAG: heme-binding protein [Ruminococcus sp.]|nr:heme-binding protein [Ruminococcus sp.]